MSLPSKKFHRSSTGVTLTAGVAATLVDIVVLKIQKGLGVLIPGNFPLLMTLTAGLEDHAEIYFGYRVPTDPRRTIPIGSKLLYNVWKDLTMAQQQDSDYKEAITVDLGIFPGLALTEDESLVLSVYDSGVVAATAATEFYIPYYEKDPGDLSLELELRRQLYGK